MSQFSEVAAADRTAAATQPSAAPVRHDTKTLLRNARHLLDQWSTRFGAQVSVGHLPGATMATMDQIDATLGAVGS